MKHRVSTRTFGRRPDQRQALIRGLATSLIAHERIETTVEKAKELKKVVEPLVTQAKKNSVHARRQVLRKVYGRTAVQKLFGDLADRFKTRNGGYTRIYRLGRRRGDGAAMALIEFLPAEKKKDGKKKDTKKASSKKKSEKKSASSAKKSTKKEPAKKSKAGGKKKAA